MENGDVIELGGALSFSELLKFQYFNMLRRTWWIVALLIVFLALVSIAAIAVALMFHNTDVAINAMPFYLLLVLWCLVYVYCPYAMARKLFKTSSLIRTQQMYRFSRRHIHTAGPDSSGEISWTALWAVRETRSMFCLYLNEYSALVIPKRFFGSSDDEAAWRQLVEKQVAPKKISSPNIVGRRI